MTTGNLGIAVSEAFVAVISHARSWFSSFLAYVACMYFISLLSLSIKSNFPCSVGIILAFTIPRVPGVEFNRGTPIANATGAWAKAVPTVFSRAPTNFSFPAYASLQLNTQDSFLPLKFKHVHASVYDLDTYNLVGTGDTASFSVPAKSFPKILIPLNFTYFTSNSSDLTCKLASLYNKYPYVERFQGRTSITLARIKRFIRTGRGRVRLFYCVFGDSANSLVAFLALKIRLVLDMDIAGLPSVHHTSAEVSDADCPIELSLNSA